MAASPLLFGGDQKRTELLCTRGVNVGAQRRGRNQKRLPHPYMLGGPKRGQKCCVPIVFSWVPEQGDRFRSGCLSRASIMGPKEGEIVTFAFSDVPKQGVRVRSGCLITNFSGAEKSAELLRTPCVLPAPPKWG